MMSDDEACSGRSSSVERYLFGDMSVSSDRSSNYQGESKLRSRSEDTSRLFHDSSGTTRVRTKDIERGVRIRNVISTQQGRRVDEKQELNKLNSRLDQLVDAVKHKKNQNDELEERIKQFRNELMYSSGEGHRSRLDEDLYGAKVELNNVSEVNTMAKIRASRSMYELDRLREKYDEEVRWQSKDHEKIRLLESQRTESLHELNYLKENCESKKQSLLDNSDRNNKLREQLNALTDALDREQGGRVDIECQIQTLLEKKKFEQELHRVMRDELERLFVNQGNNRVVDPMGFYTKELRDIKQKIRDDFKKLNEFNNESLKYEYEMRYSKVVEEIEIKKKQADEARLKAELEEKTNFESLSAEIEGNKEEIKNLKLQEFNLNKLLQELQDRMAKLKNRNSDTCDQKQNEIDQLYEQINNLKADLSSMLSFSKSLDAEVAVYARLLNQRVNTFVAQTYTFENYENLVLKDEINQNHRILEQNELRRKQQELEENNRRLKELEEQRRRQKEFDELQRVKREREEEERRRREREKEEEERRKRDYEELLRRQREEDEKRRREYEEQLRIREEQERLRREEEERLRIEEVERLRRKREQEEKIRLEEERLRRDEEERARREAEEQERLRRLREQEEKRRRELELEQERLRRLEEEKRLRDYEEQLRIQREYEEAKRQREYDEQIRIRREYEEQLRLQREDEERKRQKKEEQTRIQREYEEQVRKQCELEERRKQEEERLRIQREEQIRLQIEYEEKMRRQREMDEKMQREIEEERRRQREIEARRQRDKQIDDKLRRQVAEQTFENYVVVNNVEVERELRLKREREEHEKYILEKLRQEQELIDAQKRHKYFNSEQRTGPKCVDNVTTFTKHIIEQNHHSRQILEEHRYKTDCNGNYEKQINIQLNPASNQRSQSHTNLANNNGNSVHKNIVITNVNRSQSPPRNRVVTSGSINDLTRCDTANKYAIKHKANRYVSGAIGILETALNGEYIILENLSSNKSVNLKGWYIHRFVPDQNINVTFKFVNETVLNAGEKLKVLSNRQRSSSIHDGLNNRPPRPTKSVTEKVITAYNVDNWGTYSKFSVTKLINQEGVDKAVLTQSLLKLPSSNNLNQIEEIPLPDGSEISRNLRTTSRSTTNLNELAGNQMLRARSVSKTCCPAETTTTTTTKTTTTSSTQHTTTTTTKNCCPDQMLVTAKPPIVHVTRQF